MAAGQPAEPAVKDELVIIEHGAFSFRVAGV